MTITRRHFLYQTTAVTAGLYLPTYPGKSEESVEETDQPYLKPQAAQTTLYAVYGCKSDGYDGYELRLGSAEPELFHTIIDVDAEEFLIVDQSTHNDGLLIVVDIRIPRDVIVNGESGSWRTGQWPLFVERQIGQDQTAYRIISKLKGSILT